MITISNAMTADSNLKP
jgi:hypothetical protein